VSDSRKSRIEIRGDANTLCPGVWATGATARPARILIQIGQNRIMESQPLRNASMPVATETPSLEIAQSDLRRIEQALLDAILDVRPNDTNALDRLLSDPKLTNGDREKVERFLAAAVMDTHFDRNRALDRLLGDTSDPQPLAAHA
jgi:hypothetical protein